MLKVDKVCSQYKDHKLEPPAQLCDLKSDSSLDEKKLSKLGLNDDQIATVMSSQWWDIRGIGPKGAAKLWKEGMRPDNIDSWKNKLPIQAQMWLLHKPLSKIPTADVEGIVKKFMPAGSKNWQIVGSYRRQTPTVGDIDILYWGSDLAKLLKTLEKKHGINWFVYQRGDMKIGGMFTVNGVTVEVDIWIANDENKHAMLLYSTGSKNWNIVMRRVAKNKGLKLNQYGLYKNNVLIPTKTEEEIFEKIGMKYKKPDERS